MIGNNLAPYSYADGAFGRTTTFTNIEAKFMDVSGSIIPTLTGSTSATNHLTGTCALGISNTTDASFYTNIILDVYIADPEGLINGARFDLPEIGGVSGSGFPQGKTYLASYVVDGVADLDASAGSFDFDIGSLHLPTGTKLTVIANYSADPPGTHNGRTHSSNFSKPLNLGVPQFVTVTSTAD